MIQVKKSVSCVKIYIYILALWAQSPYLSSQNNIPGPPWKAVCTAYWVYSSTPPNADPKGGYFVDHSIFVYLTDPKGEFVEAFGQNVGQEEIEANFKEAITEWPRSGRRRWGRRCNVGYTTSAGDPQVSTGYLPKNTRRSHTRRSGSTRSHGSCWIRVGMSEFRRYLRVTCQIE